MMAGKKTRRKTQDDVARERRESMDRPLQMSDLSPREQKAALVLLNKKSRGIRGLVQKRVDSTIKAGKKPKSADVRALKGRDLKAHKVDVSDMADRLVSRTEQAASGPERLPDESLAGVGFYFDQRRPLAANTEDIETATKASARLSPKNDPVSESRTAVALINAQQSGSVHFSPAVVDALGGRVHPSHIGKTVPFRHLSGDLVDALRRDDVRDVANASSTGVDWGALAATSIGGSVIRAHRVLQGDTAAEPSIYLNPKQVGYGESIRDATPGAVEAEYKFRASHLGKVIRGDIHPGQMALDTGLMSSNEGMLSNKAPIAADIWTRRAATDLPLHVAAPAADVFITAKGDVGAGDTRVTPVGIEHAVHQQAVEIAAERTQERHQTPFTVPSRMIQETGGWAQPRRESGGDPEFNEAQRELGRNLNGNQFRQARLF